MKVFKYLTPALATLALVGCGDDPLTNNDGGGGTNPPPLPSGESLYIVHSSETVNATFDDWSNWGSGSQSEPASHATYKQIINITGGDGWGEMASSLAWGYLDQSTFDSSAYTHANFKVKSTTATTVEVSITSTKYGDDKQTYQLSTGTQLADGWVQMQVPIQTNKETTYFGLTFNGASAVSLADVYLSEEEGTTPPPPPPSESLYIVHSSETVNATFDDWSNWGSNSQSEPASHATYKQIINITGGDGWGDMASSLAWGYLDQSTFDSSAYTHANFKVKSTTATTVEVAITSDKYGDDKQTHQLSTGTQLADGWVQMQVPIQTNKETTYFGLTFAGASSVSLADVYLSQEEGTTPPQQDEFVLITSGSGTSDITFGEDTVQEWSTGSVFNAEDSYLDKKAWSIAKGSNTPEQGNWGAVLVFQNGIKRDLSEFNYVDVKVATEGGFDKYALTITADGVGKELQLPVDDSVTDKWQSVRLPLTDFGLKMSDVTTVAIMGIGGQAGVSTFYVTDFEFVKTQAPEKDTDKARDFVILDANAAPTFGEANYGEWSTGSVFDGKATYLGKAAWSIARGENTPEAGNWGTVVALTHKDGDTNTLADLSNHTNLSLQVASVGAFDKYEVFLSTNIDGKTSDLAVPFSLENPEQWTTIDIDLAAFGLNLSHINQIAVMGVFTPTAEGETQSTDEVLYVTDFHAYDSQIDMSRDKKDYGSEFVFISSTGQGADIAPDNSNFLNSGNVAINEWSTGTVINGESEYLGDSAWKLTQPAVGSGWGAVLAFTGDDYGSLKPFDVDTNVLNKLTFKLASEGNLKEFKLTLATTRGSSWEVMLDPQPTAEWKTYTIDLADAPFDPMQLMQVAIFGSNDGDAVDRAFYITDMKFTK